MRVRYCPKCGKAGLRYEDVSGKQANGLTQEETYNQVENDLAKFKKTNWDLRYCPRCNEWVNPNLSRNFDQHKR